MAENQAKTVEENIPKPKKVAPPPRLKNTDKRRSSALSLNSVHKKAEEIKNGNGNGSVVDYSQMPKEEFSQADFHVYWKKYIDILTKQGEKMLASILNSSEPDLKNTEVNLTYPNSMMLEEVKKNQTHILNFLREKLKNYQIKFKLILDETEERSIAYTPEEKYSKLREMNPLLDELRKTLYLDI